MTLDETDVAIVGPGPYGLSLAAQLGARGVSYRIFGPPMKFWRDMPLGINLKSFAFATNLVVPERGFTFPEWCRSRALEDDEPCTMQSFATYGLFIKDRFVPDVEPAPVTNVATRGRGFEITLATGERLRSRRVVISTGLSYFANLPAELRDLGPELASHTFDHTDYARFAGQDVAVLGAGASAVEAAALAHESGARARLLVRDAEVVFHSRMNKDRSLIERLRYPLSVIGPGRKNWILEKVPLALRILPEERRARLSSRYLPPAAPWWIRDRFDGNVAVSVLTKLVSAERKGNRVRLRLLENGSERVIEVDHVVAGTGYDFDLDRLSMLDPELRKRMRRILRGPALSLNFESSVPGVYFLGPVASLSFGPIFRFVCGAGYAAPAVARHLAGPVRELTRAARRWAARPGAGGAAVG
jgi:FAD-dependent urate hydroxylase